MYWSYEYISQKLLPELKSEWTIKGVVEITASLLGEKVFLIDPITGHQFSYKKSNELSNQIAHSLMGLGLTKGSRVGIYMTNRPEYVFVLFATGKAGFAEVPINPNLREPEIKHMIDTAGISTVIVEPNEEFLRILSSVSAQTRVLKNVIIQGEKTNLPDFRAEVIYASDMIRSADDSNPRVEIEPADNYCIFFTSGTTGLPKGAPISHKTFVLAAKSVLATPVTRESRNYTCLPLFHANAQLYSMMAMRCMGTSLVLSDRFSPKKFFLEISRHQATYFNSIGGMMQILDAAFESIPVPEHTAKYVFVGGTPLELWRRFEEKFHVTIFEGYSQSESPVLFLNAHPDSDKRKVGSFGIPVFTDLGRRTKIVGGDGQDAPEGQDITGELLQIGFNMKGYWREEEKTKDAFTDGWLHSGDVVRRDEDGFHYFVDRLKFMIRKGGENISAFEIEDVINSYPGISESSVVPVPDPLREEEIKAFVLPTEGTGIDLKGLIRHCVAKLAYFKVPRFIEIVDAFPKTATERIQKMELKEKEKKRSDHGWDRDKEIPDWKEG